MIAPLRQRLQVWLPLGPFTDPIQRQRALATYAVALLLMAGGPLISIPALVLAMLRSSVTAVLIVSLTVILSLVFGASIAAINLTRRGRQPPASILLIAAWYVICGIALFALQPPIDVFGIYVILMLVFGMAVTALVSDFRSLLIGTALAIVGVVVFGVRMQGAGGSVTDQGAVAAFIIVLVPGIAAYAIIYSLFQRGLSDATQRANLASARRLDLAQANTLIVERILSRTNQEQLEREVVELVQRTFRGIRTASLWVVDAERRNVTRVASTDASLPSGEKIGVGTLHVIGRAAIAGESLLVRDLPEETAYRRNALPAGIRSQLLLPLRIAADTIGILEVQSAQLDAFEQADIEALERVADQVAVGIDNARLFAAAQVSLSENKRLYEQTRANLREIERLNQQLTGQSWSEYLRSRLSAISYTLDYASGNIDEYAEWTASLQEATQNKHTVVRSEAQRQIVTFPIAVRGQVIGGMEFEIDGDRAVDGPRLDALAEAIGRMALSAENIRLFDEAQRIAQREAMVNEISERMQGTTSVEMTLSAAAQGLASVLRTSRVAIRIGSPPSAEAARESAT